MAAPKKIDYERIEPAWRAGIKSPSQLAFEYTAETGVKVSHAAIIKHFKKLGVPRDLGAKVKAKADSMVMEAMVTGKVSAVTTKRDAEIVLDGALVVANVRVSHRNDISRSRRLASKLLDELDCLTDNRDLFEQLGELLHDPDDKGIDKRNDLYAKVISLPGRSKTMKELSDTLKTLILLERQAYNLDTLPDGGDSGDSSLTIQFVKPSNGN
ncbi:hypothetical protein [Pseudomonas kribbensis]|uniref:Terminase small subunit n=1 Tax=Pseudomonas kribbensis TaxID=1628086 RepID=A0A4Y8VN59_9PSED|nr:hypothetical protein [Pseudomonas kribbensis]TFH81798.1 hypothetical protein E4J90_09475 [Pseudomonas kribbensis]